MRTQPHKTHTIDDVIEEFDDLSISLGWNKAEFERANFSTLRREVLQRIHMILTEARRRLQS